MKARLEWDTTTRKFDISSFGIWLVGLGTDIQEHPERYISFSMEHLPEIKEIRDGMDVWAGLEQGKTEELKIHLKREI